MSEHAATESRASESPSKSPKSSGGSSIGAWRRRLAPLILLVLGVLLFRRFSPHWSEERRVIVELEAARPVTALEIGWAPVSKHGEVGDEETAQKLRFETGAAPRRPTVRVKLREGVYEVRVRVESNAESRETRRRVDVTDAAQITLPVP